MASHGSIVVQFLGGATQFVDDHLEPELVGLVDDDEEQLVRRVLGEGNLQFQEVVDAQVRRVVGAFTHGSTLRPTPGTLGVKNA